MWDEAIGVHEKGTLHESRAQVTFLQPSQPGSTGDVWCLSELLYVHRYSYN